MTSDISVARTVPISAANSPNTMSLIAGIFWRGIEREKLATMRCPVWLGECRRHYNCLVALSQTGQIIITGMRPGVE